MRGPVLVQDGALFVWGLSRAGAGVSPAARQGRASQRWAVPPRGR
ncbi:hypothetical protein SVEN_4952 [Streptomyces venezuelae ATCC 10712]|uniref:Uncharacterized protein n=1 Tax=Streptomyces venezuelae (strain ATCC 10712 / CBS 650.69 / DSM 40230 / JCM 4526 / NBRC 13096 / PD 04745) TaxID=953739 RepID=F2R2W3_STRVP|nr:hypothetical protein SVEN_4952 [Streptomyces venezuelae ATCC 10712]